MKKVLYILLAFLLIAICGFGLYYIDNYNAIYYSKINNEFISKVKNDSDMKYEYKLDSYNESGHKKKIKFKTTRELKQDAYIKFEVKITGVHSWEEVTFDELPTKVKDKYK